MQTRCSVPTKCSCLHLGGYDTRPGLCGTYLKLSLTDCVMFFFCGSRSTRSRPTARVSQVAHSGRWTALSVEWGCGAVVLGWPSSCRPFRLAVPRPLSRTLTTAPHQPGSEEDQRQVRHSASSGSWVSAWWASCRQRPARCGFAWRSRSGMEYPVGGVAVSLDGRGHSARGWYCNFMRLQNQGHMRRFGR